MSDKVNQASIPEGYREDAQGRLIPESWLSEIERQRDDLIHELIARVEHAGQELAALKRSLFDDISAHIALASEKYGVKPGNRSFLGDVSLVSFDGRLRIERVSAERVVIGEQIQAAEALVREIIDEISEPTAKVLVDRAFRRHRKTGELSVARLVDLASVEIDDERWRRAVQAIRDAIRTVSTVVYFRAYRRANAQSPWRQITLDFSAIDVTDRQPKEAANG